ncbi:MAG: ribonuclease P protein component [Rudaea sp.]|nr:ribonuclease P protein component [Rudaea sp.]
MTAALSLPRTARLLRPSDFTALRGQSKRLSSRSFLAEYRPTDLGTARLGMAVSRRVSKLAVIRNRIRRVIRESFRLHRAGLASIDVLLIARGFAVGQTNAALRLELESLWSRLAPLKEGDTPGTMRADV